MNRRELIRVLSGGVAGIPAVQSLERLRPSADDVIVITYAHPLKQEHRATIREGLRAAFPNRKILILEGGSAELKVVRSENV